MNLPECPSGTPLLWTLSGDSRGSLAARARLLHDHLRALPEWSPADVGLALAHDTAFRGRRAAVVARGHDEFLDRLDALARGRTAPGLAEGAPGPGTPVAFVFPGQGSQWPGMAAGLLDSAPGFRARIDDCAQALEPHVDWSLMDVLRAAEGAPAPDRPDVVQPALFAVGVALAGLWRDHGVHPSAVLGHSCGEISAAAVSGALSLDDSARVVALWSQAQATLTGRGEMVSVLAPLAQVTALLAEFDGRLGIAAVNGPGSVIVSGDTDAAAELVARLTADGVHARTIAVGLAAHSPHIDAVVPRLHADLDAVRPLPATLPYYSGHTGDLLPEPALDARYWARNLRGTVRFQDATEALLRDGHRVLLEISPHPVLTTALQATAAARDVVAHVGATLRRGHGGRAQFLTALGEAYVHGLTPHREAAYEGLGARPAVLPAGLREADGGTGPEEPGTGLRDELARLTAAGARERLLRLVAEETAAVLGDPRPVDPDTPFTGLGLDSVTAVEIRNRLADATGAATLPVTAVFDHPTPRRLARALRDELAAGTPREDPPARPRTDRPDTSGAAPAAGDGDPVAIVAMGCRYPGGADSPEALWRLLTDGTDAVTPFPGDRGWSLAGACAPEDVAPGRHYQREAGFLHDAARFDAAFFGISPREALAMDPQQRLLLETSWETLERAGIDPHTLRGSDTGVYIGAMTMDYGPRLHEATDGNGHLLTGTTGSVASGRIAYALGLEGAAVTVDTACSSSLVALHLAVRALRAGECSLALAGGATVMPTPGMFVEFSSQGALAPDGRCKAFSAHADGFGLAEGVGLLLLERLSDARRHGHPVLALIRGSAVNQDGASNGLTAPSGPSQQRVIRAALADAGLAAKDVDAVEAHGTGTRLGDPIEAQALLATYGQDRPAERPLYLGSLKSNIGHTQAAAGVGGVLKMVLAMRHGLLPRSLHLTEPTPYVDWSAGAVRLLTGATPWTTGGGPRRAGISGFGISGTNAHVIVEEVPQPDAVPAADPGTPVPWLLSARSPRALREQAARLAQACGADVRAVDVGLSLAVTRATHEYRAVVAGDRGELLAGVRALAADEPSPYVVQGRAAGAGGTVFVFPGQGTQWAGMARELLDASAPFAAAMAECRDALAPVTDWSLTDVVRSGEGLDRVDVVQPVLFAVMVSLARVWRAYGVEPDAVIGHSQGEIAAAVVAGGLSLADGARVVALRSRALLRLAGHGGMASLALDPAAAGERLAPWDGRLSVAAVNGPASVVVSGDPDALDALLASCAADGVRARRVDVDYASHSAHVEAVEDEVREALEGIRPLPGRTPLLSTVTGDWLDTSLMDGGHWYRNLRGTVGFAPAVRALAAQGFGTFIEVGPHPVLAPAVEETLAEAGVEGVVLGTLRRDRGGPRDLLLAVGQAHARGVAVDWSPAFDGTGATRTDLPTYPFQRERFWQPAPRPTAAAPEAADALWEELATARPARLAETLHVTPDALDEVLPALTAWHDRRTRQRRADSWRHHVGWRPLDLRPATEAPPGRWLAVRPAPNADADGPDLVAGLAALGLDVTVVTADDPAESRTALAEALTAAAGERPFAGVLSLLADEHRPHPAHPGLPGALALTLALVQALGDAGIDAPLWLLTRGAAQPGAGERPGAPAQAAVAALGRCAALEHPDRWGGSADLPPRPDERTLRLLCAVLASVTDEDQVAVRADGAHGRRLLPAPPRSGAAVPDRWFGDGTVLVTGGTGGVGAHLARRLAAHGAAHLLLVGRRGPHAPGADALRAELEAAGTAVTVAACDVTDPRQVSALLSALPEDRPLTAVVHAAGVLDDGVLDTLTPARLAGPLRAKATAAQVLHEATAPLTLSAFVVFTSLMGTVGNAGQANYAAANAALESLVAARRADGLPGTALAWGAWTAGEGMLARAVADRLRERGLPSMDPADAVTAVGRAVAEDDVTVVVADADWRRFAATTGRHTATLLRELTGRQADHGGTDRPAEADGTLRQRLADVPAADHPRYVTDLVRAHAAAVLRHPASDAVHPERAFTDLGFDSLTAVELRNRLTAATGVRLPATALFDRPTPALLADHLLRRLDPPDGPGTPSGPAPDTRSGRPADPGAEPIAVVGMGCRFPGGVRRPADLWRLLAEGRDATTDWPADRGWDTAALYDPDPDRTGTTYCTRGAFVADVAAFDAEFFGISPREALAMDPQQRLLLETAWEAAEHAGQDPAALHGRPVGVFVGTNGQDYPALAAADPEISEGHLLTGGTASVLSGRVSYALGLRGPALTVDTACSSSLVAVHLAAQALRRGDCELAFAGGATVMSTPRLFVEFSRQRGLARDGRCKAFGAGADGTGWGEGAGMLLLERLADARRNGHRVLAVIRGSAVNQDGASNGLTAPSGPAQERVIADALADAGLRPDEVDAVEAHGTGTVLGDPIEAQALQAVHAGRPADRPLWLGSVKSNLGHTQAAAGVAGLMKTVLALEAGELPGTLHADDPNPHIDWSSGDVRLLTEATPWPRTGRPRRAGVSSFGISGTNAHVVVEQAPPDEAPEPSTPPRTGVAVPLLLSARTPDALRAQAARLRARLDDARADRELPAVAHALATRRAALDHRAAVLGHDPDTVRAALAALADGVSSGRVRTGHAHTPARTAFLFPGQGSQRPGAGAELHRTEPAFADALDDVLAHLAPHLDPEPAVPLRAVLFAAPGSEHAPLLERTAHTQPALFALQVALFRLTEHWGVRPDVLLGHSVGELAAAHVAGVLGLADACALVAARGRLMDALPGGGAMVAVEAGEDEVRDLLAAAGPDGDGASVAALNGPRSTVLSGDRAPVLRLAGTLRARGRRTKELAVSHAFHSPHMDGMLDAFRAVARRATYAPPRIPVISALTGRRATADDLRDPEYWVRQVRSTVRFLDGTRTLLAENVTTCLELGAAGTLSALVEECRTDEDCRALPLLRAGRTEAESLTEALAALHVRGVPVDWSTAVPAHTLPPDLPTYAFQHRRYWPAPARDVRAPVTAAPLPGGTADAWTYRVTWRALPDPAPVRLSGTWLLVVAEAAADAPLAGACRAALTAHGADVTVLAVPEDTDRAALAARLPADPAGVLSLLAPAAGPEATLRLVQALGDAGTDAPLWCVTTGAVAVDGDGPERPAQAQVWGLGRVAALEHPRRWGGLVDLPERPDDTALRRLCALLAGAVRAPGGSRAEDQVAVRADAAYGRRLVREPAAADRPTAGPAPRPWTARGTVLVTGGLGGLGAQVARRLARSGADHLVLTGRRGTGAPGADPLVRDLTAAGTRVTVAACDVADRSALADLLAGLAADGDTVRAVFHAAGVTSATRITDCTPALLAEETAAKVRGTTHLDDLLGDDLDAFVLFSSVSAVWGSAGQATYAAANAFLDATAARRRARGRAATCVAWGPWAGPGMARGETGTELRRLGLVPMAPEAALDALWRALDRDDSGHAVADMDWARFAPAFRTGRESALLDEIPEAATEPGEEAAAEGEHNADRWRRRLAPLPAPERRRLLTDLVRTEAAAVLGHDTMTSVTAGRPFHDLGLDSLTAVELRNRLAAATGLTLPAATVFDHPTATALGEHLLTTLTSAAPVPAPDTAVPTPVDEPLAVIGMACRFPGGVRSPEDLWDLVAGERDTIGPMPDDRGWPLDALYDPDPAHEGTFSTSGGGFLDGAGDFDAEFFGISPREALAMDPQQRLLLETSWEALERAGLDPTSLRGSQGGVYLGVAGQGYGTGPRNPADDVEGHLLSGTVTSVASGRVAYTLGTEGPAVTVETACSSSLVALHLAGQALRTGECSFALVGGAAVMATPDAFVEFSRQRGLSPDGRCRSFADDADGTGWGEGVGVLVVERLSDARRAGHPVLAVIRGSAVNQDGASNGLTAPSGPAQQRVLRRALAAAGLTGGDVDLVEAHGTGTVLGDPIEAQALLAVYGQDRPAERPLYLGSLKSNIGHTQAAAGVAGVIKTVMALRHGLMPRTLHVDAPTTKVDWSAGAVRLLTEARPWEDTGRPRRAAVSAFGMSGTNAHAVLEQAPDDSAVAEDGPVAGDAPAAGDACGDVPTTGGTVILPLSAASPAALRAQARRLRARVEAAPGTPPADLAHALARTRTAFPHRAAVTGGTPDELIRALTALGDGAPAPGAVLGRAGEARTVFVFPGQGAQWVGMGCVLLECSPVFAGRLGECARVLEPLVGWSLVEVLRSGVGLERVDVVQPVLFAVMVSLAEVWRSWGVVPDAVVGHSQGEIAAACVAGALSLEDAARVVALRSKALLSVAGRGGMVSLAASEDRARELLLPHDGRITVAGVNGPQAVVVAGEPAPLDALLADCARASVRARRLPVDYAAHSAQVAPVGDTLRTVLADIRPRTSDIPLYSTVTGTVVDGAALDADHWYRNLREPVAFAHATESLLAAGFDLFVEVSPHPVLTAAVTATAERAGATVAAVGTVRRDDAGTDRLLASLAEAWTHGAPVDWAAVLPPPTGAHVPLPTYAFQHRRYWLPAPGRSGGAAPAAVTAPQPETGPPGTDPAAELAARLAQLDKTDRRRTLLDLVLAHAAALLGHTGTADVDPERPFVAAGFDSMLAVTFRNRLAEATGVDLPPTTVFDHPTPAGLAAHLDDRLAAPPAPERPVLARLDQLADALADTDPATADADEIGVRLRDLLHTWTSRRPRPEAADGADATGTDTATATADELFELLDNNYGA